MEHLIRYGPGAYEWVEHSEALPFAADQLAQAKVDGELFLFGGSDDSKAVYKFRESSNEFLKVGSLQTSRIDAKDRDQLNLKVTKNYGYNIRIFNKTGILIT